MKFLPKLETTMEVEGLKRGGERYVWQEDGLKKERILEGKKQKNITTLEKKKRERDRE